MPVMSESVRDGVLRLLGRYNPDAKPVSDTTELAADLNIDSVAAMDLIMEIEDHFEIDLPMNQVSDLQTVGDLVGLVQHIADSK